MVASSHRPELISRSSYDTEKRMICVQARLPGVSVSRVARRYDVNANLVFSWLSDPRFTPDEAAETVDRPATRTLSAG